MPELLFTPQADSDLNELESEPSKKRVLISCSENSWADGNKSMPPFTTNP